MEYWMYSLFNVILLVVSMLLDNLLDTTIPKMPYGGIYILVMLLMVIPSVAMGVRRLHDIGKSGWWMLLLLFPLIGGIWLLVMFATKGNTGPNEYGADPKEIEDGTFGSQL